MGATVSIGAAAGLAVGCNIDRLISRADTALYAAKESGRNRVVCAPEEIVASIGAQASTGPLEAVPSTLLCPA
jgi:predicted signal transduction protein with EAL and GGDEF domain